MITLIMKSIIKQYKGVRYRITERVILCGFCRPKARWKIEPNADIKEILKQHDRSYHKSAWEYSEEYHRKQASQPVKKPVGRPKKVKQYKPKKIRTRDKSGKYEPEPKHHIVCV